MTDRTHNLLNQILTAQILTMYSLMAIEVHLGMSPYSKQNR